MSDLRKPAPPRAPAAASDAHALVASQPFYFRTRAAAAASDSHALVASQPFYFRARAAAAASDAHALGASQPFYFRTSLLRLNKYIHEYFMRLNLTELAKAEHTAKAGLPRVVFVRAWIKIAAATLEKSALPSDTKSVMKTLNLAILEYLKFLRIDGSVFNAMAWKEPNYKVDLIQLWMERIYPKYNIAMAREIDELELSEIHLS